MSRRTYRWLVTGANGMLGTDLVGALRAAGESVLPVGREEVDVTDRAAVRRVAIDGRPDVIVNCAAFTRVDACEEERERAERVNGTAVGHLADAAERVDALLLQLSTDFVFDGTADRPYRPEDATAPLSAYGASKLLGEREARHAPKHVILRTSWLFGTGGPNFVEAIRRQVEGGRSPLRVVHDQRGRPTFTPHLADAIVALGRAALADGAVRGIVHYADAPDCTWYEFAVAILRRLRPDGSAVLLPVTTDEFPRPAKRPAYSVLDTSRYEQITGRAPASWEEGLDRYFALTRPG